MGQVGGFMCPCMRVVAYCPSLESWGEAREGREEFRAAEIE